jgi:hypothetical protein
MSRDRITYESKGGTYRLNPGKIFGVFVDVTEYSETAPREAKADNFGYLKPFCKLTGDRRELVLTTEVVVDARRGHLDYFDLARLTTSEDGCELGLEVAAHERVLISPDGLYDIAKQYMISSDS